MKRVFLFISSLVIAITTNAQAPTFEWAKSVGGTGSDLGYSVATDASGNVYTIGLFTVIGDFDPGPATLNFTSAGGEDIFLTKLSASGNLLWAEQFGGTSDDEGTSVSIDGSGNVYIAGTFSNVVDFDPGPGVYNLTSAGAYDIFVAKLDAAGNFVWAKDLGGASYDFVLSLALDSSDNVYTTGVFENTADFDPGAATFNMTSICTAGGDMYISKLDSSGNFVYAKDIGGNQPGRAYSITTDGSGNVYTSGYFQGTVDFDPGAGVFNLTPTGLHDLFILKLDSAGNFAWVKSIGGSLNDAAYYVKTDASGNIYSSGSFQLTV
ncbi:MAG TPA: SBBP repeat-containing protein, partial [Bacteroidia bacterium]|nr:SBBP repeat-containing protein [Bacteroidia bacterium]